MKTRNGVYYNLALSEYRETVNGLTFVFSSQIHKDKFLEKLNENRDIINYSLSKRFKMKIDLNLLADIVLYKKIESRGFLILKEDKEIKPENLCFKNGQAVIKDCE